MPLLRTHRAEVAYEVHPPEWAGGAWVTLVNGFSRPGRDFRGLARFLTERGFSVLTFDNRGAGETTSEIPFQTSDIVDDLRRLWAHLGVSGSHLLGISYGGVISQLATLELPAHVLSLALVSSSATSTFIRIDNDLAKFEGPALDAQLRRYFSERFLRDNQILGQSLLKELRRAFQDPERRARAQAQREAMGRFNLTARLPELTVPTLILHGGEDHVIDVAAAQALAAAVPRAQLVIFPEVGHLLLAECARAFYEKYATFLQDIRTR